MSDWGFLNHHRAKHPFLPDTDASSGFNGYFVFFVNSTRVQCVASDGGGWQHVSVSVVGKPSTTPRWDVMCAVKDLFWNDTDCVVQFHPPKSEYKNLHQGCLHMWKSLAEKQPIPPSIMVAP